MGRLTPPRASGRPQPDAPCAEDECAAGDVGTAGACEACGALDHCPHVTSAPARDRCVCAAQCDDVVGGLSAVPLAARAARGPAPAATRL